jgi:hypothetical protein
MYLEFYERRSVGNCTRFSGNHDEALGSTGIGNSMTSCRKTLSSGISHWLG